MISYNKNKNSKDDSDGFQDFEDYYDNEYPYSNVSNKTSELDSFKSDNANDDVSKPYDYLDENAVDYYQPFDDN